VAGGALREARVAHVVERRRVRVARQAQEPRAAARQQIRIGAAVGQVALAAAVAPGPQVLVEERAGGIRMAAGAFPVDPFGADLGPRPVRVVALDAQVVDAAGLVVVRLHDLGVLSGVARCAGVEGFDGQQTGRRGGPGCRGLFRVPHVVAGQAAPAAPVVGGFRSAETGVALRADRERLLRLGVFKRADVLGAGIVTLVDAVAVGAEHPVGLTVGRLAETGVHAVVTAQAVGIAGFHRRFIGGGRQRREGQDKQNEQDRMFHGAPLTCGSSARRRSAG